MICPLLLLQGVNNDFLIRRQVTLFVLSQHLNLVLHISRTLPHHIYGLFFAHSDNKPNYLQLLLCYYVMACIKTCSGWSKSTDLYSQ